MKSITDQNVIQEVLGHLANNPTLLSQTDKFNLSVNDFNTRFQKYIFTAISGLYSQGMKKISVIDIENYLSSNPKAIHTFTEQNGREYIQDILDLVAEDTSGFQYYYLKLKKINLLRDLQKQGFDISNYYCDDALSTKFAEVNGRFENTTIEEICTNVKQKILKLENEYSLNSEVNVVKLTDGLDELIGNLQSGAEIGIPLQGTIYNQVLSGAQKGCLTIRSAPSGCGKALPNYLKIPTPNGERTIGELNIGDYLWGDDGKPTQIIGVYPQIEPKEIYKITFKDGRTTECCKDHLWSVFNSRAKNKKKLNVFTTEQLINQQIQLSDGVYHYSVPLNKPIQKEEKVLYPDPYVMGASLGDGSFRMYSPSSAFVFSSADEELVASIANLLNLNYKKNSQFNYGWTFKFKQQIADRTNLHVDELLKNYPQLINCKSEDKFIPEDYLEGSIKQRKALLQGLLDTDGTIDQKGCISYYSISKQMAKQVQQICWELGYIATITEDKHKPAHICYRVHIQCDKQEKISLFRLTRKKQIAINYARNNKRNERRDNNTIISIQPTGKFTDMTCFQVDNESHLFLINDYITTHNTSLAFADACYLAFPIRYSEKTGKWEQEGSNQHVLFIITEQMIEQAQKKVLSYLSGIPESVFKYGNFDKDVEKRLQGAYTIMKEYEDNFTIVRIPDPDIQTLQNIIREQAILHKIDFIFYDYIFISPALLSEFRGHGLRNDELLLLMTTALKDLAVELNVGIFTSTQVNASADNNREIRNEASLAGGRATINKADNGIIMARPTNEELDMLKEIIASNICKEPNRVFDVFKVRSGQWSQVRIWSHVDLGTMRVEDLFITDSRLNPIDIYGGPSMPLINDWTDEEEQEIKKVRDTLNGN